MPRINTHDITNRKEASENIAFIFNFSANSMHMHSKYPCLNSLNTGLACFNKRTEIHPCMLAKDINKGGKVSANLSRNSKIKSVQRKMMKKLLHFKRCISLLVPKK